jgi:hypothetical protein
LASDTNKEGYVEAEKQRSPASAVLKLGLVSAASAIVGGLAAAWWYRKTLSKLQNPIAAGYRDEAGCRVSAPEIVPSSEKDELPHLISD